MTEIDVKVRNLCAQFLGQHWFENVDVIEVTKLESGTANQTFKCALKIADSETVIVKIYGSETAGEQSGFKFNGESGEAIICYILSSHFLAPELIGVFDGGRIEQFVQGRNPTVDELKSKKILEAIAGKLIKLHCVTIPVTRRIIYTEKMIESFGEIKLERDIASFSEADREHIKNLFAFPLIEEYKWYQKTAPRLQSPIVFAHNDVHRFNIMLKDNYISNEDRIVLLDFEISGYNYRGFDIGYFLQSLRDKISTENGKFVYIEETNENNDEVDNFFMEQYVNKLKTTANYNETVDNLEHIQMEYAFFCLPISLGFLGFVKRALNTSVADTFESFEFISDTIESYKRRKENVFQKYASILN